MISNCPVGGALRTGSAVRQCVAVLNKLLTTARHREPCTDICAPHGGHKER